MSKVGKNKDKDIVELRVVTSLSLLKVDSIDCRNIRGLAEVLEITADE